MGRQDSPLQGRVIFVEGAPRSGTTLLVTLLATHPEIAGVQAESHLFDFGQGWLYVFGLGVAGGIVLRGTPDAANETNEIAKT